MTQLSAIQDYPCPHTPLLPGTAQHVAVTQPSASPSDASDMVDATDPLRFTKGFALASCSGNIQIYEYYMKHQKHQKL